MAAKTDQTKVDKILDELFSDMTLHTNEEDVVIPEPEIPKKKPPTFEELNERIRFCVQDTLQEMSTYRLAPRAKQIIEDFITFHLQVEHLQGQIPEVYQTYYNLLIRTDSKTPADTLVDKLCESLKCIPSERYTASEDELLRSNDYGYRNRGRTVSLFPVGTRIIYIHSCQAPPQVNSDAGTSTAINDARKKQEHYNNTWSTVFAYLAEHTDVILIVQVGDAVYRTDLRKNNALFYRICSNHVFIPPSTQEELWKSCLRKLQSTSFVVCDEFKDALHDYFTAVYPKAELREHAFIRDLLRRIYALYLCKPRQTNVLTTDCIPKYQAQVISPEDILGQMNALVGLASVKSQFRDMYRMQLLGLNEGKKNRYHMVFSGNPGTGKTTVAQMAADLFYRMGILKTNRLIVTKPTELISQWIGGTGIKTSEVIRQAYDGVLLIDEAYGLNDNRSGAEVMNVLIQEMENNADRLVVILAGYKNQMADLMDLNPGLTSRIGRIMEFEDYSVEELVQIFHNRCRQDGFTLEPEAEQALVDCLNSQMTREYFGNAREVGSILQRLKEAWSREYYDVANQPGTDLDDIPKVFAARHFADLLPEKSELGIQDLIGLNNLKESLAQFKKQAAYQKHLREMNMRAFPDFSMHMLFTGNPGTGKTTVAKLIANDLYSVGVLKTNRLVVAGRQDLVSRYVGETAPMVQKLVQRAAGGVLFIDEAYSLSNKGENDHASEAVEVLLTAMEEHKSDTVFIFAGYVREMQEFLASNPGIRSRIGYTFHFEDYSTEELVQIFSRSVTAAALTVTQEALDKVYEIMEYFRSVKNFGNGRFVAHVFQQVIFRRASRDYSVQYRDITLQDIPDIKTLIDSAPDGMHLYDPGTITPEAQRRTAIHEIGHAIVMYATDPNTPAVTISIRSQAASYGRVRLPQGDHEITEQKLLNRIATAMGGIYAEKAFFGQHTTGCASDYQKAKYLAKEMLEDYAMDSYGDTPENILAAGKELAARTIEQYKATIEKCTDVLLEQKELTGEEFIRLVQEQEA